MFNYIISRVVELVLTLLVVSLIIFTVVRVIPGDPAQLILGMNAAPENLKALREDLGLNRPMVVQYLDWVRGLLHFDLGESITYNKPVSTLILHRLGVTLPLTALAAILGLLIALPMGVFAATRRSKGMDMGIITISQLGMSIPAFWFGILLLTLFSVNLGLLPAGGFPGWLKGPVRALLSLTLPVLTLGLIQSAALTRMTRASVLEVLASDFVRTARSKGIPERNVLFKHVLKNSSISIVTLVGLQVGQLLAGAIVVEMVFHLPGLGRLLMTALQQRDLPLVQGIVTVLVAAIIIVNFLVDFIYSTIDPRIRLK
ncbi:MAG: ABC transporter permease [Candidatus Acetothermia bacterium]